MPFEAKLFHGNKPVHGKALRLNAHDLNLIATRMNVVALCAVFAFIGAVVFGLI